MSIGGIGWTPAHPHPFTLFNVLFLVKAGQTMPEKDKEEDGVELQEVKTKTDESEEEEEEEEEASKKKDGSDKEEESYKEDGSKSDK